LKSELESRVELAVDNELLGIVLSELLIGLDDRLTCTCHAGWRSILW
jgi:hypothetical protein